jgi:hypothetical protein
MIRMIVTAATVVMIVMMNTAIMNLALKMITALVKITATVMTVVMLKIHNTMLVKKMLTKRVTPMHMMKLRLSIQMSRDCQRTSQDKAKKPKTVTTLIIQESVTSMAILASSYASKKEGKFSVDEVMKQVLSCGATYDSNEHFIATELFVNKQQREMFMTLPSNHRFNWLTRRYITKYGN